MTLKTVLLHATLTLFLFLTACKKEITVPNQDLEKLFGTWEWVISSGGISGGQTSTPATEDYTMTIEYKKNGIYIRRKNGIRVDKVSYDLTERESIYDHKIVSQIKYEDKHYDTYQSVKFGGDDTLYLSDECYDCFGHTYIRKK